MRVKRILAFVCVICICIVSLNCIKVYSDEEIKYRLKVNLAGNYIAVYDINGASMPVKIFACSAFGNNVQSTIIYTIKGKEEWTELTDGTFSKNVTVLDEVLSITTAPYNEKSDSSLVYEKFNELGETYTGENIWLSCADAKWIYDNCAVGTEVEIYSDEKAVEISIKPSVIKIPVDSAYRTWDPSDDNESNPWQQNVARIEGVRNIYAVLGEEINVMNGITGYDTCGNDISNKIILMGNYDINKVGEYKVTYYLEDSIGSKVSAETMIIVKEKPNVSPTVVSNEADNEQTNGQKIKILIFLGIISCIVAVMLVRYSKK